MSKNLQGSHFTWMSCKFGVVCVWCMDVKKKKRLGRHGGDQTFKDKDNWR